MISHTVTDALTELWELTRTNHQRMRVHRPHPVATDETIFVLEITNHERAPLVQVKTKNLESAARWILDNHTRR